MRHGMAGLPLVGFPDWRIEVHELGGAWIAVRQQGRSTRVIAAHDLDTLRAKLEKAQANGDG